MKERVKVKEADGDPLEIMSSLDISGEEMHELTTHFVALVTEYFSQISSTSIFPDKETIDRVREHTSSKLPRDAKPLTEVIDRCRAIIAAGRNNSHPRFFGYVASPAAPIGALADLVASAINQNVTSWRSAPAATEIEKTVVRWLTELIGYSEGAHGILVSGGSMANLNAILMGHRAKAEGEAARNVSRKGLWNERAPATLYASDQTHFSIAKAASALGFGSDHLRIVRTDEKFRLDVRDLRERVKADLHNGFRPFCIVANAGTVNSGAVDPLNDIADITDEYKLWLHVDGAYGAIASLDQAKRSLFIGIERADSVSLDPHKWLYAPIDCGCLLFREHSKARAPFSSSDDDAAYVKVYEKDEEAFAFWDYGLELSRRFRALKIWMMLCYYGSQKIAEAISKDNALAGYLGERVATSEDFELLAPVELSICCFRYVPPDLGRELNATSDEESARINEQLDELNARIMLAVQRDGRAYLSNARLRGRFALRACITNFRTTRADIDATLDIIRHAAVNVAGIKI